LIGKDWQEMATYKFSEKIGEDHLVKLPAEIPAGWAEIQVVTGDTNPEGQNFLHVLQDLLASPVCHRSKEDIDRALHEERTSWE
jgi:hypothetical protein